MAVTGKRSTRASPADDYVALDGLPDVVVVGAGNAGACAALAAAEAGARVLMLEASPREQCGGNSRYTNGAYRFAYNGFDDFRSLVPRLGDRDAESIDFGRYTAEQYLNDIVATTSNLCDRDLVKIFIRESLATLRWLNENGVPFEIGYRTLGSLVGNRHVFNGGLVLEVSGIGPGLVESQHRACARLGVEIRYDTQAVRLLASEGRISGVQVKSAGATADILSPAVVLACGGFESNAEMRARYLGPAWDLAKVRGTRFNMGRGLQMALEAGALPFGHWSGCHAISWDLNAPPFGDLADGVNHQRHGYPLGIIVNADGRRFVDEGEDLRNFTYARYGAAILQQPKMLAWQVFDGKVLDSLPAEYRFARATRVVANTLGELAAQMTGLDGDAFLREVTTYNAAVRTDIPFSSAITIKDGRRTEGLPLNKSNWANRIDTPPFEAFGVTCGITFTYGGLKISVDAEVEDIDRKPIAGLFAAGEIVGGLFYHNYPGGTGLTSGAVFGRAAGMSAARHAARTGFGK